jgi:hypothetical protein
LPVIHSWIKTDVRDSVTQLSAVWGCFAGGVDAVERASRVAAAVSDTQLEAMPPHISRIEMALWIGSSYPQLQFHPQLRFPERRHVGMWQ